MKRRASKELTSTGKYKKSKKPVYKRQSAGLSLAPELKYNDTAFNTDATTGGAVIALSTFAAGDTALLRDGMNS